MAAVSAGAALGSTTDAATYALTAFTPTAGNVLFGIFAVSGTVASDWAPSDNQSGTWTKLFRILKNTSADFLEVWVREGTAAAVSTTVTFSHASGNATGGAINVFQVSGLTRTGTSAVKQSTTVENQASGTAPVHTFAATTDTNNPTVVGIHIGTNGALTTFPTGWNTTGLTNAAYNTPANTARQTFRDSGFAGTTITWGSNAGTAFSSWAIELDTSAAATTLPPKPTILQQAVNRSYNY